MVVLQYLLRFISIFTYADSYEISYTATCDSLLPSLSSPIATPCLSRTGVSPRTWPLEGAVSVLPVDLHARSSLLTAVGFIRH